MLCKTFGSLIPMLVIIHITHSVKKQSQSKRSLQFEDFTRKFDPSYIWEQIDKRITHNGENVSDEHRTDMMMTAMDPTDVLLNFKVENGNAAIIASQGGRRGWRPPNREFTQLDPFSVRRRLLELMKQAIYQTRNKLVTMQIFRAKYRSSPLYKMGFLMSRTDTNCKIFSLFSFRAFRVCMLRVQEIIVNRFLLFDAMQANERQLQHWFNIELLVELIEKNDENCKKMLREKNTNRKDAWKFIP